MWLKNSFLLIIIIALVGWAATEGYDWYAHGRFIEETDNAYIKSDNVSIRAEITGRIETLAVQENQHVLSLIHI